MLEGADYRTKHTPLLDASEMLLAENRYYVLGVVSCETSAQVVSVEQVASMELANTVAEGNVGAKQWDTCLVVLTSTNSQTSSSDTQDIFSINYDLRFVRRLVHLDVLQTLDSVRRALAPFRPLPDVTDTAAIADPLSLLVDELSERGVTREQADEAIVAFNSTPSQSDA